jgi:scyllo-inositol 2-dehydrogenase (NADP+)
MSDPRPIVTSLLSYGMSGEVFHAPLLAVHPGFALKSVLQRTSAKAKDHYPEVEIVRQAEEVFSDKEVELIVVNTPNETHFDFASKALRAGKHVVVEKPFTNTSGEARKLIEMAQQCGKTLTVFQSRRWDGAFLTLRNVLSSGVLGKVVEFESHYDRFRNYIAPQTWKEEPGPGSGILYNLGSHLLDQVLLLFGNPSYVDARIGIQRPGGKVDDFYDVRLEYPGLNVIVKSSYLVCEPGPFYTVHGVNGSFIKYGIDPQEEALKQHQVPGTPGWGTEPEQFWGKIVTEVNGIRREEKVETQPGNYLGFYQNLYDSIRAGKSLAVTGGQALKVIQLIESAIQSSRERRAIPFS